MLMTLELKVKELLKKESAWLQELYDASTKYGFNFNRANDQYGSLFRAYRDLHCREICEKSADDVHDADVELYLAIMVMSQEEAVKNMKKHYFVERTGGN